MNLTLKFSTTGNFWVDNGLIGLYRILHPTGEKQVIINESGLPIDYTCTLNIDSLQIAINPIEVTETPTQTDEESQAVHKDIITVLNWAKAEVVRQYLKATGAGWIYQNNEFKVYRKTDFKMHLKPFFTGKTPSTEGALCSPEIKDNDMGAKGRRMNEDEFKAFIAFKESNSPVIIADKKYPLVNKGFLHTPPKYEIGDDFNVAFLKKGKKQCAFSGEKFALADTVSGMDYPFLTGKAGELNFASFLSGKPSISAKYSYVALFSFFNLYYLMQGDLRNYFILYDSNIKESYNFYRKIQINPDQLKGAEYCNFRKEINGTQYESESLLAFIIALYQQTKNTLDKDSRYELYTKSVYSFINDGNIFRDVKEYTSLERIFSFFNAFQDFNVFHNFIKFFQEKLTATDYNTLWRNKMSTAILSFQPIASIIENFMSKVKMKEANNIAHLNTIIETYNSISQIMNSEMIKKCRSIGMTIGEYSRLTEDKSLLFSIRNARNRIDFLKILSQAQFKIAVSDKASYKLLIYDEFFEGLPDTPQWEEYKSLVSIFAMNTFLSDKLKEKTTPTSN